MRIGFCQNSQETKNKPENSFTPSVIHFTLDSAIERALSANRDLLSTSYQLTNRNLSVISSESEFDVKFIPEARGDYTDSGFSQNSHFEIGSGFKKKHKSGISAAVTPKVEFDKSNRTAGVRLALNIPLFKGFGSDINLNPILSAKFAVRTAERSFYQSRVNTVIETVINVYEVARLSILVGFYARQVDRFQKYSEISTIKERAGLASPIDIYRAKIRMKDAQNRLAQTQEAQQNAKDRLKLILGLPLEQEISVSTTIDLQLVTIDSGKAESIAMANRVELEQADDALSETMRASGIARHNLLPDINLNLNYNSSTFVDDDDGAARINPSWGINLTGSTDWSRRAEKTALQQAVNNIRISQLNQHNRKEEIKREVRSRLVALTKLEEQISFGKEQIKQAQGKRALSEIKYRHQLADNFDLIESETEIQIAKVNLLEVTINYIVNTYRLRATLGTLLSRKVN